MSLEFALAARQFASLLSEIAFEANVPRESSDERDGHLKKLREDVRAQTRHLVGLLVVRDRLAVTDAETWPGGFMAGMPAGSSSRAVRRDVEAARDRAVNLVHAVMHGSALGDRPDQLVTASESLTALARLVVEIEHDAVMDEELVVAPPTARTHGGPAEGSATLPSPGGAAPVGLYAALEKAAAAERLPGIQKAIVAAIVAAGRPVPLAELHSAVEWSGTTDSGWSNNRKVINEKLNKHRLKLNRLDSAAIVVELAATPDSGGDEHT